MGRPVAMKIESLARALADAWHTGRTVPLPETPPASRAEAYAIQDRMADLIGGGVAGWKVGATVKAVQRFEGHDGPLPGRIFSDRLFRSPAVVPARVLRGAKVECEFAMRLTQSVTARSGALKSEDIAGVSAFHPAIEIAASRWAPGTGNRATTTFDGIADNGTGGAAVLGDEVRDWRSLSFETMPIDARIDDSPPIQIYGGAYRRHPLDIFAETLNDLAARGVALDAGLVVLTGSLSLPTPIRSGQSLVVTFADFAPLQMAFT